MFHIFFFLSSLVSILIFVVPLLGQLFFYYWLLLKLKSRTDFNTCHVMGKAKLTELSLMAKLQALYLFSYNFLQFLGWTTALFRILSNLISTKLVTGAYASAGELICLLQCCAFLEVIHGAIGIVPSGVVLPLMQWSGRTHFVLAIVRQIVEVKELPSMFITFSAWSLTEVIRYSHYALSCIGSPPYLITYLRYTAFILLYPVGVGPGEIWLMYQALPFIKRGNLYANSLPFSYYNFIKVLLVLYPLLWLKLYLHLFKQRRSKLGKYQKTKKI
ncbi:hypothetical protein T459_28263 [Capsicum annuum]|uniref:Very-long-chain (3R)-3-hydroxyacyl-CoA dehydratase n=1 Tax=Capsicum annuum TaxID=4072 RepID=A0A2G2YGA2_CAPAN|nr:very-long-chain (3R)-3-hydroxyacyl-CoA dehydratase 2 isoform X2 [Capsicum annuum]PHT68776.1 hypothetical protein T459_28263 [Capsicum annuum]